MSIKYNEIRPGNILLIENHPQKVLFVKPNENSVTLTDEPFIIVFHHHEYNRSYELYSNEEIGYLPITNTHLKKLGFKWLGEDDSYCYSPEFGLRLYENGDVVWQDVYLHGVEVKYVHELQNLYHSLTKRELPWVEN